MGFKENLLKKIDQIFLRMCNIFSFITKKYPLYNPLNPSFDTPSFLSTNTMGASYIPNPLRWVL